MAGTLGFNASWIGIPELESRIIRLLFIAETSQIGTALMPGAQLIAERWRAGVPSPGPDHPYSTGRYRDSIQVAYGTEDLYGIPSIDIFTDAINPDDSQYPYPVGLEYGTSKMRAQPSAQPAFDESVDEAIELAAMTLDTLINGVVLP